MKKWDAGKLAVLAQADAGAFSINSAALRLRAWSHAHNAPDSMGAIGLRLAQRR
jgi:hypothetical protein